MTEPKMSTRIWRKIANYGPAVALLIGLGSLALHVPLRRQIPQRKAQAMKETRDIALALEWYWRDFGSYPPDTIAGGKCSPEHQMSETLVHYLGKVQVVEEREYGPYHMFRPALLADSDGDGFPECRDPWGGLYLYAENASHRNPTGLHPRTFDIVSPGTDGKLEGTMSPETGYVPATTPEGKEAERDNVSPDVEMSPGERDLD